MHFLRYNNQESFSELQVVSFSQFMNIYIMHPVGNFSSSPIACEKQLLRSPKTLSIKLIDDISTAVSRTQNNSNKIHNHYLDILVFIVLFYNAIFDY